MSDNGKALRGRLSPQARITRMLGYWAANAALYLVCVLLILDEIATGQLDRATGHAAIAVGVASVAVFYLLIRRSPTSGIPHWKLAWAQGFFAAPS